MRWLLVALAALVTVAVAGTIALRAAGSRTEPAAVPATARTDVAAPGNALDALEVAGNVAGQGAVEAARRAVESTGRVVAAGFISRRDLIASFTTPRFGPVLSDDTSSQVTNLLLQLGAQGTGPSRLSVREVPLVAVADLTVGDTSRVKVWSVLVVTLGDATPARAVWRTSTLEMRRIEDVWLVDGWVSELGPAPALLPDQAVSTGREIAALLAADVTWIKDR